MPYRIFLDKRLDKTFAKMEKGVVERVLGAIEELEHFSPGGKNIKKLHTPFDGYRKRVGGYRVLFKVLDKKIFIYSVKHRKDAYR